MLDYRIYVGPIYDEIDTKSPNFRMWGVAAGTIAGGSWRGITASQFGRHGGGNEQGKWYWVHGDGTAHFREGMPDDNSFFDKLLNNGQVVFKMNDIDVFPLADDAGGEFIKIIYGVGGGEEYLYWRCNPPKPKTP
jgi:hypothetical protein